jgi:hypothetical protein
MNKTNEPSKLGRATLQDRGTLANSELNAVTGGRGLMEAAVKGKVFHKVEIHGTA